MKWPSWVETLAAAAWIRFLLWRATIPPREPKPRVSSLWRGKGNLARQGERDLSFWAGRNGEV